MLWAQDVVFTIDSPEIGTRKIRVHLPEDYDEQNRRYPVLYLHDAQNLFDAKTSFAGEWRVDETLDSLHAKIIVVGIDNGSEKRLDELTPYPNAKHGGGQGKNYVNFIVNTLMPKINSSFRTKTGRRNTAIGGSSLGGLISWYAALEHPGVFGKALIFSPSLWYSDDIYKLTASKKRIRTKTYLLAGDSESKGMVPEAEKLVKLIGPKMRDRDLKFTIVPGGKHNEKLWAQSFAKAYLWLF